jgi:hypothetical protein
MLISNAKSGFQRFSFCAQTVETVWLFDSPITGLKPGVNERKNHTLTVSLAAGSLFA